MARTRKSPTPRGMNATETAAYRWLLTTERYTPDTLTFQRRASPSFRGADGRGWEPKLARNAVVVFTAAQIEQMHAHPRCSVLILGDGKGKAPGIMPAASVPEAGGYWRQYLLRVTRKEGVTKKGTK